ncbi:phage holin [Streptococcus sp. 116-D4]|uniref:phage holin n=1 Tax=Streptococcus sp. 116-D4 TaxID=2598453 RepID=UPI0012B46D2B|nr:phage holin [Streptococcus sp. 116-D4]BBP09809.1 holin [Streptococcus sp. 116-D4]
MINWKLRFKNKVTLVALIGAFFLMLQQLGLEIPKNIQDGVNTFVYILVLMGVVNDPTTSGITDSTRALEYKKPSEE